MHFIEIKEKKRMELQISVWFSKKHSILHLNSIYVFMYLLILNMSCISSVFITFPAILSKFGYTCVLSTTPLTSWLHFKIFFVHVYAYVCACVQASYTYIGICFWLTTRNCITCQELAPQENWFLSLRNQKIAWSSSFMGRVFWSFHQS